MIQNTNTELLITRDGEVTHEFDPSILDIAATGVSKALGRVWGNLVTEVRLGTYDLIHDTDYLATRHAAVEKRSRERFEARVGWTALRK